MSDYTDRLFDPTPQTTRGVVPRDERPVRRRGLKPVETVTVLTDGMWRLIVADQPGVVHAAKSGPNSQGGYRTHCGRHAGARTFEQGSLVRGCAECAAEAVKWVERGKRP